MAHPGPPHGPPGPPMRPYPIPPTHPAHPHHAHYMQKQATAKKLVMYSHIFGWGGVGLLLLIGPILATVSGAFGMVVIGLGLISAIAGAVIGQVGRGMQGRVI